MTTPHGPSPLSFNSGRPSPFKRQNSSASPVTVRTATPTQSPSKAVASSNLSPTKTAALSLERASPFGRRPSQISQTSDSRPASPFARPTSSASIPASPSRQDSYESNGAVTPSYERQASMTPASEIGEDEGVSSPSRTLTSPSGFDGTPPASPSNTFSSRPAFSPTAQSTPTAPSTTSTIKPPIFTSTSAPKPNTSSAFTAGAGYSNIPPPLLRSMRESFEVLDSSNTGSITSASISSMLEQIGLDSNLSSLKEFFPPSTPSQLNLARYLDTLSAPLNDLSAPEELAAAFSAFDVDDSGQIDVAELRNALLNTLPEPGEEAVRLNAQDVDGILGDFSARRAFGAKGVNVSKAKGDVFRYRDFMVAVSGGGGAETAGAQELAMVG